VHNASWSLRGLVSVDSCWRAYRALSGVIITSKGQDTILQSPSRAVLVNTEDPYFPGAKNTLGCMYASFLSSHFRNAMVVGDSCDADIV